MQMKVADYILDFIISQGVTDVFGLIGGTCGILIDRMGQYQKEGKLKFVPMLHEQSASIAVEGYARAKGFGVAIVSSGPAVTNIMTGVQGAFHDSIPCLYIAGQQDTTNIYYDFDNDQLKEIRQMGTQEGPHVSYMKPITKYAALVQRKEDIRYHLERAVYHAKHGRPGPAFLDIPKDLQGFMIDPEELHGFDPTKVPDEEDGVLKGARLNQKIKELIDLIKKSERPVILFGGGVRLSGTIEKARKFAEDLGAPVVLSWGGIDAFPHDHPQFVGSIGDYATRAGNFTVQNCDLLISVGSRLDPRQTTKEFHWFARGAKVVMVDISNGELQKEFMVTPDGKPMGRHIDLPIRSDLRDFFDSYSKMAFTFLLAKTDISEWTTWVDEIKGKYPVVIPEDKKCNKPVNPRAFIRKLSELAPANYPVIADCGINQILTMTSYKVKEGQRMFENGGSGALGYSITASIGMSYALGKKPVISIMGDGGFQFNIQELQTIGNNKIPIKMFVLNNKAYGLLVNTQDKSYGGRHVASVAEEDGYSAPDFCNLAMIYGIKRYRVNYFNQSEEIIKHSLKFDGPTLVEVMIPEGKTPFLFVNYGDPLEDMRMDSEYLPVSEMKQAMRYVPLTEKTLKRENGGK